MTEQPGLDARAFDVHNTGGPWQGHFRVGPLDLVATRYALDVLGGVDTLAVTHADRPLPEVCSAYEIAEQDAPFFLSPSRLRVCHTANLEYQEALGGALFRSRPVLDRANAVEAIRSTFAIPIGLLSRGPTLGDKSPDLTVRARSRTSSSTASAP